MHARVLSFIVAALTIAAATSLEALPELLRNELLQKHAQGKVKHDWTGRPWSVAMGAWVILRHKRDGASFAVLAGEEAVVTSSLATARRGAALVSGLPAPRAWLGGVRSHEGRTHLACWRAEVHSSAASAYYRWGWSVVRSS